MANLSCWVAVVGPARVAASRPQLDEVRGIRFLRRADGWSPDMLYIAGPEELRRFLSAQGELRGLSFFVTGALEDQQELAAAHKVNLVCCELDEIELYERLAALLRRYQEWSERLLRVSSRHNIQEVVQEGARLTGTTILLLNMGGRVIYAGGTVCASDPLVAETLATGRLSDAWAERVGVGGEAARHFTANPRLAELDSGNLCWVYTVLQNEQIISTMLMVAGPEQRGLDAQTMLAGIQHTISDILTSMGQQDDGRYWAGTDFKLLLDDILYERVTGEEELNRRFSEITLVPQRFISFLVIEPQGAEDTALASGAFLTHLERIFPNSNVALYDHAVILLISRPDRDFQPYPLFNGGEFNSLLARYNAHAAISNATSKRSKLRTALLLARSTLYLGRLLNSELSRRYFFFEDYADYLVIDLCITGFQSMFGHDDLVYLTHPDIIKLFRYDKKHQENLLDVLYYYCLNNLNLAKTAKDVYMHRNTVTAKVRKITGMIRSDLTNGVAQQRMIFSYKVLRYCERVAKIDMNRRIKQD